MGRCSIYTAFAYDNSWSAEDLSVGTYYYQLEINSLDKVYKGPFLIA